jgi:RNA polymerase sigma factor (sigma-70 family)
MIPGFGRWDARVLMVKPQKIEVENLARRMAAIEEEAFAEFANIFGPKLRAFFITRGLRAAEAEDLAVSSITDICLRIEKYAEQEDGSFESWVYTLARNFLVDWHRSRPQVEPLPLQLPAPEPVEGRTETRRVALVAVREAIETLSDTDQMILTLRHLEEERSFSEIGQILGIEPGTARTRHSRALAHLKEVLEGDLRVAKVLRRGTSKGKRKND